MTQTQELILKEIALKIEAEGKNLDRFNFGCQMAIRFAKAKKKITSVPISFKENGIEQRKKEFYNCLANYLSPEYPKKLLREFYDYWTEIGEGQKKMRFEKESSFELSKRLARWKKNQEEKAQRFIKPEDQKIVAKSPFKKEDHGETI